MGVFKEINKADGSGVTQFFRLSTEKQTVETNDYGDFYNFKGGVASRKNLPTTKLETGDAYFIEDEEKTVFWDGTAWREINAYVLNYNYNDASNKPLINGHVLSGDKSAAELELQPAGDYLTEIPEEYITEKELEDLDLADKNYVIDQINNTEHFHREIVDGLPVIGKDNVIYMVKKKSASGDDIYDEWMWVDTKYEHIGSTATDLSDYYKKEEADKLLDKKVNKVTGKGLSTNDYTTAEKTKLASLENYDDTAIKAELATLHNYDDTDIKNDITALKTAENGLKTDVSDIKEELKDKIEGVRLVRSGDMWDFYTVGGTRLTYEAARELLGHPNTILYMEGVENDGKTTPADYDIDEELIHVHYMDEDGEDRYLQMGYPNTASAEGSYIHIEDAVAQPISELKVDGASEQKTYTGKNLLNYIDNLIQKLSGLTNTINPDGSITTVGKPTVNYTRIVKDYDITNLLEDGQKYTISQTDTSLKTMLQITAYKNDGTITYYSSRDGANVLTINKSIYTKFLVCVQTTSMSLWGDSSLTITNKYMLCKGTDTADTSFEPYTGGQQSPNPDYPQKIKNVRGVENIWFGGKSTTNNGITFTKNADGSYDITGTATAEANCFNYINIANTKLKNGINYNLSINKLTNEKVSILTEAYIEHWDSHVISPLITSTTLSTNKIINIKDNITRVRYVIRVEKGQTVNIKGLKIQLEEGSIAHNFVPNGSNYLQLEDRAENLIGLDNKQYRINLKKGDKILAVNNGTTNLNLNLYTNYGDTARNDFFTIAANSRRPIVIVNDSNAIAWGGTLDNIAWVVKGEKFIPYEPYKSESTLIDLKGNELCSLPNGTKDELVIENNRAKINKKIGKVILDGSDDENWGVYSENNDYFFYSSNVLKTTDQYVDGFCSHFINSKTYPQKAGYFAFRNKGNTVYFRMSGINTIVDWRTWLSTHNTEVQYELAEPKTIDLGEIDMPATFEGVNNITIDSDLNPNIKINYVTNVNYLDKNIGFKNHYIGYYEDIANLPTGNKGDIAIVSSDKRIYINDGNEWVPSDKNSTIDLSNYLAKDNTTGYAPTGNYNPATKKYVDDSVKGINIPTKTSQLTNDSNFVIKTTNELTNYYTKNNTYTKNEVNALVTGGGGGDSKIETLDITGGKDITALLHEGSHIYYLACDNEDDSLRIHIRTITGKKDTINLLKGAIVSLYYTKEDNALLLSYFGGSDFSSPNYGTFSTEGSEITKNTILDETRYTDINYIAKDSAGSAATLTANYINMFIDKRTVPVYLNGSESKTDLEFPKNTIIIGRNADFVTRQATGLIIFPTGVLYKITSANIVDLHIEELSFATEDYVKSREMSNLEPGDGTGLFGWYSSTPSGGSLTENGHVTPNMVENIKVGQVYEWPSTVYVDGQNRAVVIGTTKVYDHWSVTRASGGEGSYKTFIIYLGNGNVYTYAFDDTNVYKETYPSDK